MTYREIGRLANTVRGLPLTEVLPHLGAVRDGRDQARWKTPNGVISVTGTRFYDWHQNQGGGGAIDLVMHVRKSDFKAAVLWLRDLFAMPTAPVMPSENVPALRRDFQSPTPCERHLPQVIHYLEQERRLPEAVLAPLVRERQIYADARSNVIFLMRNGKGRAVGAELRGTGSHQWRGLAPGSQKSQGYFVAGREHAASIILCESAIDALSAHTLYPDAQAISTAGASPSPAWLQALLNTGTPITCGFDADEAGDQAAKAMIDRYPTINRLRPARHDWNDLLRARQQT